MQYIFKKLFIITIALAFFLALPTFAFASNSNEIIVGDRIVFGGSYRLKDGEVHEGSIVSLGGSIIIDEGAVVTGDLLLFGGNLILEGSVYKSVIIIGAVGKIDENAVIGGDLISPATVLDINELSEIGGQVYIENQIVLIPEVPDIQIDPVIPVFSYQRSSNASIIWFLIRMLAVGALAIFTLMFIPKQSEQIRSTMLSYPIASGGFGFLSLLILIPFSLLAITIILSPLTLIYWILVFCGALFGWVVVGLEVGDRIAKMINREWSASIKAGIGTISLAIFATILGLVFWGIFGFVFVFIVVSIGLGAVFMTRFGTKEYISNKPKLLPID